MSRNSNRGNDELIAKWIGMSPAHIADDLPCFCDEDTQAVTLLPVLVEKGYFVHMDHRGNHWWFATRDSNPDVLRLFESTAPTIAQAITKTLIQLIESI